MMNFRIMALASVMTLVGSSEAFAEAHCWCKASFNNLTGASSASGVVKDYGAVGGSYKGLTQQSDANQRDCSNRCTNVSNPDQKSQALANAACAAGAGNGAQIKAFAAVGTRKYETANGLGVLQRAAAQYSCAQGALNGTNCVITVAAKANCAQGYWLENHKQPFKCVKQACAAGSMPGVPAWLAIGGAVNGGQYLTDDKGGSRFFVNATLSCDSGFTLAGSNCVKTVAATLVSAAICKLN